MNLPIVFWNYQGDRLSKFLNDFGAGFNGFTDLQKNVIIYNESKLKTIKNDLKVHVANDVPIGKTKYKLVSVFVDSFINEVADHVIKNYKADIGFVVNLKTKKVSLRKAKSCDIDLGHLATKLFDAGGGHAEAAGGLINEKFLNFSKLFHPINIKVGS